MICGNEIFFVKKMPLQKADTPIYLDLDLDLDTLRLYSLLSYAADQDNQIYCLGMLDDFVTKLGLKIDTHNSLLKLYLYRYISIEKNNKQINISIYNERIRLLQFINIYKQYIDFINNNKFKKIKEQYFANQIINEISVIAYDKNLGNDSVIPYDKNLGNDSVIPYDKISGDDSVIPYDKNLGDDSVIPYDKISGDDSPLCQHSCHSF